MDTQLIIKTSGELRFIAMMDQNVMLWSDERLERERAAAYVRWCFDTGDPFDLSRFELLEAETELRKLLSMCDAHEYN